MVWWSLVKTVSHGGRSVGRHILDNVGHQTVGAIDLTYLWNYSPPSPGNRKPVASNLLALWSGTQPATTQRYAHLANGPAHGAADQFPKAWPLERNDRDLGALPRTLSLRIELTWAILYPFEWGEDLPDRPHPIRRVGWAINRGP